MNRKNDCAAGCGFFAKEVRNLNGLARIQPIEGFVQKKNRLWREQREGEKKSPAISARQFPNTPAKDILQFKASNYLALSFARKAVQIAVKSHKSKCRLLAVRNDILWKIKHHIFSFVCGEGVSFPQNQSATRR